VSHADAVQAPNAGDCIARDWDPIGLSAMKTGVGSPLMLKYSVRPSHFRSINLLREKGKRSSRKVLADAPMCR